MGIRDIDLVDYSPLVLAYIGDSIYEIIVRTCVVTKGNTQVNKLHKKSSSYVNAHSQAVIIMSLMDKLTDEEIRIYKRGRNAKSVTMAKMQPYPIIRKRPVLRLLWVICILIMKQTEC